MCFLQCVLLEKSLTSRLYNSIKQDSKILINIGKEFIAIFFKEILTTHSLTTRVGSKIYSLLIDLFFYSLPSFQRLFNARKHL